jgi:hypothetical protein
VRRDQRATTTPTALSEGRLAAMLAAPWTWSDALRAEAMRRGFAVSSVTPIAEVAALLRASAVVPREPDERVGQMSLWWSPAATPERRAEVLTELRALAPARRGTPRAPRVSLESRGTRALAAPDHDAPSHRALAGRYIVRVWYTSEGGEELCFDTHPLTEADANELELHCATGDHVAHRFRALRPSPELHPVDAPWPPEPKYARLVVLPSQRADTHAAIDGGTAPDL